MNGKIGTAAQNKNPGGLFPGSGQGDRAPATTPPTNKAFKQGPFKKNDHPQGA